MSHSAPEKLEALETAPVKVAQITVGALIGSATLLLLFAWVADEVARQQSMRFDLAIRDWVHTFASPAMTMVMQGFSIVGGQVLTVLAIAVPLALWWFDKRRAAAWMCNTMLGALVLDLALKYGFHRTRPVPFFGKVPLTYSFPSGHSLFSFCFFGTLAGLLSARTDSRMQKIAIYSAASLLIFCIGLSRIYLGVHYPTDVLGGYLAAAVWVSAVVLLDRYRSRRAAR